MCRDCHFWGRKRKHDAIIQLEQQADFQSCFLFWVVLFITLIMINDVITNLSLFLCKATEPLHFFYPFYLISVFKKNVQRGSRKRKETVGMGTICLTLNKYFLNAFSCGLSSDC